jgi:acetylornithine deacetylase/succinyl-diaminopimelate desuccinylase-like protein
MASQAITGKALPVMGESGGSDARWFNANGIPAICYGPGHVEEGNYHGVNENLRIESLTQATAITAAAAHRFLQGIGF